MSYPKDLDDYSDETLLGELRRRSGLRAAGKCSYCQRKYVLCDGTPCLRPNNGVALGTK